MEDHPVVEVFKNIYLKFLDIWQSILFFAAILLIIYIFVAQPHEVSGLSMYPTFDDKQLLLSNLLDVNFNNIRYGDVVVFHAPDAEDKLYIKRVIGLPGDKIKLQGGYVFLNNKKLDESSYLKADVMTYGGSFLFEGREVSVPVNKLFVLGDNRPYSSDSRAWGFLAYAKLVGRSMLRFWPVNTFYLIPRDPYR